MLYQKILKPIIFLPDPETAHNLFINLGEFLGKFKMLKILTGLFCKYKDKDISKTVDGITYKTPFILAAGFDYNGRLVNIMPEISFGGEEVGSVTAKRCEGNEKPRIIRLPKSQSYIINKGLRNDGVETVMKRLKKYKKQNFVIGVSIGRTNDKEAASVEAGIEDYFYSFKRLNEENIGDYYTLNISCPNAFGGESFVNPETLPLLLAKICSLPAQAGIKCDKPIYIKMPINLEWQKFDELLKIIDKFPMIKGVIIGNLNKDYSYLEFKDEAPKEYKGGLSGKPCFELSNKLIRQTRAAYGKRFTIIGCGGVQSVENMKEKFEAGSDLVQLITSMIYNGPGFIKELAENYSKIITHE
jgi:dihydroorotate dehydrogenase